MRNTFSQSMAWLHTWCGLVFGWLLFAVFLTGTLSVFEHEIDRWMRPELRQAGGAPRAEALARADQALRREALQTGTWRVVLPDDGDAVVELRWGRPGGRVVRHMDAATGDLIAARQTLGGHFFVDFHYSLLAGRTGIWAVAAAAMAMLATLISGVVIHKRIFKDFFTFRPNASGHRAWLDAHNVFGVLALPFHLMITYTGLAVSFAVYMPVGLQLFYGGSAAALRAEIVTPFDRPAVGRPAELLPLAPLLEQAEAVLGQGTGQVVVVRNPGDANAVVEVFRRFDDRIAAMADHAAFDGVTGAPLGAQTDWNRSAVVWRTLTGLHLAQFGGGAMRCLYFLCGAAGTAMVGSGLVLFTVKRRRRHAAEQPRFERAVERLNVAAVAGVGIACVAYLWINRLLPAGVPDREAWEVGLLLPVWLAALVHALVRRPARAWPEQVGLVAVLCAALPALDAATAPLRLGDLDVDLVALVAGLALGFAALRLARKTRLPPLFRAARASRVAVEGR